MAQQKHIVSEFCPTKLEEISKAYESQGRAYIVNTRPYHSVQSIQWDIVQPLVAANPAQALAVARPGQICKWFTYGQGQVIRLSGNGQFQATEAETTLTEALKTNNDDFAIQWVGAFARGNKVEYAANPFTDTDPDVLSAMLGQVAIADPFSYRLPAEAGSPALLEMAMYHALAPFIAVRFEWDNGLRTEKVGTLDQFTQGGGASYLHANGEPSSEARCFVPEGYSWTRSGQPGSQMAAYGVLTQAIVMPISLSQIPGGAFVAPTHIWTELVLRLGGTHFITPSGN